MYVLIEGFLRSPSEETSLIVLSLRGILLDSICGVNASANQREVLIYQLLYMDKIPDYSAVSETVSICPKRSKGYVNACLRSFLRKNKQYDLPENEWEALSITTSIPADILSIFRASYGDECAKEIALAIKPKKGVTARINTLKVSASEFKRIIVSRGIKHTVSAISDEILILDTPISEIIDLIDKGFCFIQDVASFTCTKIFAPSSSSLMLDACSCPGGKSFSCAIDMKNSGKIVSCDLSPLQHQDAP